MKTLVMFVLMMVLYAQPAQAAQAQADVTYFEFSSASYGYETVLPAVQLQPGLYVYLFKQTAGQLGIDFYPDIQVIANPPQCAANWNEHPFGATRTLYWNVSHESARTRPVPCRCRLYAHDLDT